jgi:nucleotide-binding universal stress UspA family protein
MNRKRVLIPLDGSEFSERILRELTAFISPAEGELILLRVGHAPIGSVGRPSRPATPEMLVPMYESAADIEHALHPIYASQEWDSMVSSFNDDLQPIKTTLENAGYKVSTTVKVGDPGHAIVQCARAERVDLIAMTTHGRSGLRRLWLGSVAEYVLRNVNVPVLLMRSAEMLLSSAALSAALPERSMS